MSALYSCCLLCLTITVACNGQFPGFGPFPSDPLPFLPRRNVSPQPINRREPPFRRESIFLRPAEVSNRIQQANLQNSQQSTNVDQNSNRNLQNVLQVSGNINQAPTAQRGLTIGETRFRTQEESVNGSPTQESAQVGETRQQFQDRVTPLHTQTRVRPFVPRTALHLDFRNSQAYLRPITQTLRNQVTNIVANSYRNVPGNSDVQPPYAVYNAPTRVNLPSRTRRGNVLLPEASKFHASAPRIETPTGQTAQLREPTVQSMATSENREIPPISSNQIVETSPRNHPSGMAADGARPRSLVPRTVLGRPASPSKGQSKPEASQRSNIGLSGAVQREPVLRRLPNNNAVNAYFVDANGFGLERPNAHRMNTRPLLYDNIFLRQFVTRNQQPMFQERPTTSARENRSFDPRQGPILSLSTSAKRSNRIANPNMIISAMATDPIKSEFWWLRKNTDEPSVPNIPLVDTSEFTGIGPAVKVQTKPTKSFDLEKLTNTSRMSNIKELSDAKRSFPETFALNENLIPPINLSFINSIQSRSRKAVRPESSSLILNNSDDSLEIQHSQENVSVHNQENVKLQNKESVHVQSQENVNVQNQENADAQNQEIVIVNNQENLNMHNQEIVKAQNQEIVNVQHQETVNVQNQEIVNVQNQKNVNVHNKENVNVQNQEKMHDQENVTVHNQENENVHNQDNVNMQNKNNINVHNKEYENVHNQQIVNVQNQEHLNVQNEESVNVQNQEKVKMLNKENVNGHNQENVNVRTQENVNVQNPKNVNVHNKEYVNVHNQEIVNVQNKENINVQSQENLFNAILGNETEEHQGLFHSTLRPKETVSILSTTVKRLRNKIQVSTNEQTEQSVLGMSVTQMTSSATQRFTPSLTNDDENQPNVPNQIQITSTQNQDITTIPASLKSSDDKALTSVLQPIAEFSFVPLQGDGLVPWQTENRNVFTDENQPPMSLTDTYTLPNVVQKVGQAGTLENAYHLIDKKGTELDYNPANKKLTKNHQIISSDEDKARLYGSVILNNEQSDPTSQTGSSQSTFNETKTQQANVLSTLTTTQMYDRNSNDNVLNDTSLSQQTGNSTYVASELTNDEIEPHKLLYQDQLQGNESDASTIKRVDVDMPVEITVTDTNDINTKSILKHYTNTLNDTRNRYNERNLTQYYTDANTNREPNVSTDFSMSYVNATTYVVASSTPNGPLPEPEPNRGEMVIGLIRYTNITPLVPPFTLNGNNESTIENETGQIHGYNDSTILVKTPFHNVEPADPVLGLSKNEGPTANNSLMLDQVTRANQNELPVSEITPSIPLTTLKRLNSDVANQPVIPETQGTTGKADVSTKETENHAYLGSDLKQSLSYFNFLLPPATIQPAARDSAVHSLGINTGGAFEHVTTPTVSPFLQMTAKTIPPVADQSTLSPLTEFALWQLEGLEMQLTDQGKTLQSLASTNNSQNISSSQSTLPSTEQHVTPADWSRQSGILTSAVPQYKPNQDFGRSAQQVLDSTTVYGRYKMTDAQSSNTKHTYYSYYPSPALFNPTVT